MHGYERSAGCLVGCRVASGHVSQRSEGRISNSSRAERGAGLAEYGLLVALVAVVSIPALIALGPVIVQMITTFTTGLGG